ncbi:MAG: hypothetical protein AAF613_09195 [Pseudomonadota bacterium]
MVIDQPDYCRRPSLFSTLREIGTPLEVTRLARYSNQLMKAPRGDKRPIVLLPGFQSPEIALQPLSAYLNYLGYSASTWGFGVNTGKVDELTLKFGEKLARQADEAGEPITLIGWSLGGVIARETARLFENSVREVITMGTPLIGGPKYTSVGSVFARQNGIDLDEFEKEVHRRNSIGLTQPLTCIYSKSDGIVGWTAAIDVYNPQARNVEVDSTHFGLGVNPKVWTIVAETLVP